MESIHLFYSWQSDREGKVCRHFVGSALAEAATRIKDQRGVAVQIDSDTAGVAGTPPVTDTILEKIRVCDIFVADMSFVGSTDDVPAKLLPNPNVMAEYGYARAVKGNDRILLVMNTVFGPPTALPFDLQAMRYPTAYNVPPGMRNRERQAVRSALVDKLVPYISAIIDGVLSTRRAAAGDDTIRVRSQSMLQEFEAQTIDAARPALIKSPRLLVRIFPAAALNAVRIDPSAVKMLRTTFIPTGFALDRREDFTDARQWASFDPPRQRWGRPNPESYWYVRLFQSGYLELNTRIGARIDDDPSIVISGRHIEVRIVDAIRRLAGIADSVGLGGPFAAVAALHGLEDIQIDHGGRISQTLRRPDLFLGSAFIPEGKNFPPAALRSVLDAVWLEAGFEEGSPSFGSGDWDGDMGGPLYTL